jgi:sec-independent protein translocase protein TatC
MWFGTAIVNWIQAPLVAALAEHREKESIARYREQLEARAEQGDIAAKKLLDDPKSETLLKQLVNREGMLPDEVYLDPREVLSELRKRYPKALEGVELPPRAPASAAAEAESAHAPDVQAAAPAAEAAAAAQPSKADLIPLHLWRSIEDDERNQLISTGAPETFMIWLKASFLAGAILSSPFVFYFLWSFVAAGLYPHEKHYVQFFLPFSVALFLLGASTAFLFVFPPVLSFFFGYNRDFHINTELRISEWLSFVLLLPLGFGISFQLPLVMLFLERIGIFGVQVYIAKWRIAVLVLAVLSMVLSPGSDPYSMLLMLAPLVGLYFGGIGLCKWLPRRQSGYAA